MLKLLLRWSEPRPNRPDVVVVQAYTGISNPDVKFEMRLNLLHGKGQYEPEGFHLKSSWGMWYYSKDRDSDYPHLPRDGYWLCKKNIKGIVMSMLHNYERDIIRSLHRLPIPPLEQQGFQVLLMFDKHEQEYHKALIDQLHQVEEDERALLGTEADEYIGAHYNYAPHMHWPSWRAITDGNYHGPGGYVVDGTLFRGMSAQEVFLRTISGPICADRFDEGKAIVNFMRQTDEFLAMTDHVVEDKGL